MLNRPTCHKESASPSCQTMRVIFGATESSRDRAKMLCLGGGGAFSRRAMAVARSGPLPFSLQLEGCEEQPSRCPGNRESRIT